MSGKKPLTPEDLSKLVYVEDPQISPDGRSVAFVASRNVIEKDKVESNIWIIDVDSGEEKYLHSGEDYSPRWAGDSKRLLFLSRRGFKEGERGVALYVVNVGGGEPREVLRRELGIGNASWSPEGNTVFFVGGEPWGDFDKEWQYYVSEDLPVWFDGEGFVGNIRSNLFSVDLYSRGVSKIISGNLQVVAYSISNSGDYLAYAVVEDWRKPLFSNVYIAPLRKLEDKVRVLEEFHVSSISWSPNDKFLLVHGSKLERGYASHLNLYTVSLEGQTYEVVNLTESLRENTVPSISTDSTRLRGSIYKPLWVRDDTIYFLVNKGGRSGIFKIDPTSLNIEPVLMGDHAIYHFTVSRDGSRIAFLKSTPTSPPEVYVYDVDEGRESKITDFNKSITRDHYLAEPRRFSFKASDGVEVEGWYLPPRAEDGSARKPVILFIHGGPKASYGYTFTFIHQMMAGNGYYVLYLNPRGSDGYSEEFADIRGRYGERDYQDLMEGVEEFLKRVEDADEGRMGVTGISYGGFMTNWVITQTRRFKAAVTENSISYWISDFYTSDIGFHFDPDQIGKAPWENVEGYLRQSPLTYVDNVETPVLIIHSMEDYRCFIDQSVALHVALRLRGKHSKLVVFSKGSHGHSILGSPKHKVKRLKMILEFFNKHLKGGWERPAS